MEQSEWDAFEAAISANAVNRALDKVKQLAFEIHTKEMTAGNSSLHDYVRFSRVLNGLHEVGFRRWYWHSNPLGVKFKSHSEVETLNCCYEVAYININYLNVLR